MVLLTESLRLHFKSVLVVLLLAAVLSHAAEPDSIPPSRVLVEGEELVYNVRYGPFNLGQVRIRITGTERKGELTLYRGRAHIASYRGVPFVDLDAVYQSWMDTTIASHQFIGRSRDDKHLEYAKYVFDYAANRVLIEKGTRDSVVTGRDTMEITTPFHDGLSLFFYARDQVFSHRRHRVPALVKEEKTTTLINFMNKRTAVEIDAVDYPVDVVEFDGVAEFVGIFGLTGAFSGWFSWDDARIPIMAKMKVIIGSVTLELMEWKRPGWVPPRAGE